MRHIKHPIPRFEKYRTVNTPRGPVKGCVECQMILERHPNHWIQHHDFGHHTWGPDVKDQMDGREPDSEATA